MKRQTSTCIRLLILLVAITPLTAKAQVVNIIDRAYSIVGLGAQAYYDDRNRTFQSIGYQGEVGIGANLFDNLGARISGMAAHNSNSLGIECNYLSLHADLTLNVPNLLFGKDLSRKSTLMALVGVGFMRRQPNYRDPQADNEVTIVPGLSYTYPIGLGVHFLAEAKAYIFLPGFDHNEKASTMFTLTAGIQHRFNDSPYRNGLNSGSHSIHENWFASLSGGINSLQYSGLQSAERTHLLKPAAEFAIGKYLSPVVGTRIGILGLSAATSQSSFNIVNAHLDILLNINNMRYPRQNRPLSFYLYLGAGLIDRFDNNRLTVTANAGLLSRVWLSNRSDLLVDLRYMATTSQFVQEMGPQGKTSVGMFTASIGYCFNITSGTFR